MFCCIIIIIVRQGHFTKGKGVNKSFPTPPSTLFPICLSCNYLALWTVPANPLASVKLLILEQIIFILGVVRWDYCFLLWKYSSIRSWHSRLLLLVRTLSKYPLLQKIFLEYHIQKVTTTSFSSFSIPVTWFFFFKFLCLFSTELYKFFIYYGYKFLVNINIINILSWFMSYLFFFI